jgi:transcriptional regulator with XRE-family HTH domain
VNSQTRHPFGIANSLDCLTLRVLRGPYTQAELSKVLELNTSNIQKWEAGEVSPSMGNLRALLSHYNDWTGKLAGPALDILRLKSATRRPPPTSTNRRKEGRP